MIYEERKTVRPAFQFYPADWLNDKALRMCSRPARSFWIDMLCLMHSGVPYGTLTTEQGQPISIQNLAKLLSESKQKTTKFVQELRENQIFSEKEDGTIYSRRLVRDEDKRLIDRENGLKGGNPVVKLGVNPPLQGVGSRLRAHSSSSSSSLKTKDKDMALSRFVKPTIAEVKAYCEERNNSVDPLTWLAYYESNGWRVGRNPMKSWKAAIITWEKNSFAKSPGREPQSAPVIG